MSLYTRFLLAASLACVVAATLAQTSNVPRAIPVPTVTSITGTAPVVVTPTGTVFDIKVLPIDLYRDGGKANHVMTGGGTVTLDAGNSLSWTQRFIILGAGRGGINLNTSGFYDINMPPLGTIITGMCGVANAAVTAAGIDMDSVAGSWSSLWYQLPAGGSGFVPANLRHVGYTADCVIPNDYVLLAAFNHDNQSVRLGTGQIVKTGLTNQSSGNDFFRSDNYGGAALPNGTGDNAKNIFLNGNLSLASSLAFKPLNDGRNTLDGITWYPPTPASYGLYRTAGTWVGNPYQQLKMAFDTGIELQPSVAGSVSPSYTKSYVNISAGGLRVERGLTGLGTLTPATMLHINGAAGARPTGAHIEATVGGAAHPIYQQLNWGSDNISTNYDVYFNGGAWTRSGTTGSYQIYKNSGVLNISAGAAGAVGTAVTQINAITVLPTARVQLPATPDYASVAAANADAALLAGTVYTVTRAGAKQLFIK